LNRWISEPMGALEGAWGIHLGWHQFNSPFSISRYLLIYVCHTVLSFEEGCCLRFLAELELWPPPAVHGYRHTGHAEGIEFPYSQQSSCVKR
jgi:hypothetical protein